MRLRKRNARTHHTGHDCSRLQEHGDVYGGTLVSDHDPLEIIMAESVAIAAARADLDQRERINYTKLQAAALDSLSRDYAHKGQGMVIIAIQSETDKGKDEPSNAHERARDIIEALVIDANKHNVRSH